MSDKPNAEPTRWTVLAQRPIYDNPWITVTEFDTLAPTGAPALYGLVHFKKLALGIVPIDADGCTFLVGQQRFTTGEYSWELPEGGGAPDGVPVEGAQRELSEEVGLRAAYWHPLIVDARLSNSVTDERAFAWLAWDLVPDASSAKDVSEDLTVRRVPFIEAVAMAISGEITDAFSLVMLLKVDHLLRTGALDTTLPATLIALMQGRA